MEEHTELCSGDTGFPRAVLDYILTLQIREG